MNTLWCTEKNGEVSTVHDVTDELGEPALLVASNPDWVKTPSDFPLLELAGKSLRVLKRSMTKAECPSCSNTNIVKTVLCLEQRITVTACSVCGNYSWARTKE